MSEGLKVALNDGRLYGQFGKDSNGSSPDVTEGTDQKDLNGMIACTPTPRTAADDARRISVRLWIANGALTKDCRMGCR